LREWDQDGHAGVPDISFDFVNNGRISDLRHSGIVKIQFGMVAHASPLHQSQLGSLPAVRT
jgi:hypothetical protein